MSWLYKKLIDADITPELTFGLEGDQPDLKLTHEELGEIKLMDPSQHAMEDLLEYLISLHEAALVARKENHMFQEHRED